MPHLRVRREKKRASGELDLAAWGEGASMIGDRIKGRVDSEI